MSSKNQPGRARPIGWLCLAFVLVGILSSGIKAQVLYGSIVGNVHDKSDAVVAGATVKITNKETNQSREAFTSPDGSYNFPTVQTGTYSVTVSKSGFKTYTR